MWHNQLLVHVQQVVRWLLRLLFTVVICTQSAATYLFHFRMLSFTLRRQGTEVILETVKKPLGSLWARLDSCSHVCGVVCYSCQGRCLSHQMKVAVFERLGFQIFCVQRKNGCLLYTSPSPRDSGISRMPSSA